MKLSPDDLREISRVFLEGRDQGKAIRSKFAIREHDGGRIYLKHANKSLAPEAAELERAARSSGPERASGEVRARALPFLGYDPDHNVLCTEFVEGESLFNALWNGTSALAVLRGGGPEWAGAVPEVFEWIADYHRQSADGPAPDAGTFDSAIHWLVETTLRKCKAVAEDPRTPLTPADVAAIRLRVEEDSAADEWKLLPLVRIHGDLTLANLLAGSDGLVHITDFADARTGFALEDVCRLWSGVWEISECGRKRRKLLTPTLVESMERYGLGPDVVESTPFLFLRLFNAVTRLSEATITGHRMPFRSRRMLFQLSDCQLRWIRSLAH